MGLCRNLSLAIFAEEVLEREVHKEVSPILLIDIVNVLVLFSVLKMVMG